METNVCGGEGIVFIQFVQIVLGFLIRGNFNLKILSSCSLSYGIVVSRSLSLNLEMQKASRDSIPPSPTIWHVL